MRLAPGPALLEVPGARVLADDDVVEHAHPFEEDDVLERPRDPDACDLVRRPAQEVDLLEADASGFGAVQPRDDVEQGRLPGAVRPDQACDLPLVDREETSSSATTPPNLTVTFSTESNGMVA